MAKTPLLIPAVGVTFGAWLGCCAPWWIAVIFPVLFLGFAAFRKNYWASVMLMSLAAFVSAWIQMPRSAKVPVNKELCYSGEIVKVNPSNTGSFIVMRLDSLGSSPGVLHPMAPTRVGAYVQMWSDELPVGARITFKAEFEKCVASTDLPYELDPNHYLLKRRIFASAIIKDSNLYTVTPPHGFTAKLNGMVSKFKAALKRSDLSPQNISFLCTVTVGDTSSLFPQYREVFSNSGLAHLLALSGMHVALMAWIITVALWPLKLTGRVWPVTVMTVIFLWMYAIATGMSPSVMRAVLMATVYALSRLAYRSYSALNALCFAVIVLVVVWPDSLFSVGFQLSVVAVASILLFADKLNPISPHRKGLRKLFNLVSVPMAAMLATAPFCAYYFHSLPLYFLLSNFAASVLLLPLMLSAFVLVFCEMAGFHVCWLCDMVGWFCDAIYQIADFVSSLPGSRLSPVWIPSYSIIPAIGALLFFRIWIKMKGYQWLTLSLTMFVLSGTLVACTSRPKPFDGVLFPASIRSSAFITVDSKNSCLKLYHFGSDNYDSELKHTAELRYTNYLAAVGLDSISVSSTLSPSIFLNLINERSTRHFAIVTSDTIIGPTHDAEILYFASAPNKKVTDSVKILVPKMVLIGGSIAPHKAASLTKTLNDSIKSVIYSNNSSHFF